VVHQGVACVPTKNGLGRTKRTTRTRGVGCNGSMENLRGHGTEGRTTMIKLDAERKTSPAKKKD